MKIAPVPGDVFGSWTVVGEQVRQRGKHRLTPVRCRCGFESAVATVYLLSGRTSKCVSCDGRTLHGESSGTRSTEYRVWRSMRQRCAPASDERRSDYAGREIRVCERWLHFPNFLEDMGRCPDGHSLDRIDNEKGYEPGNCRWATGSVQQFNKRPSPGGTGIRGVWVRGGKYSASITRNRKKEYLGLFDTLEEAVAARRRAEPRVYPECFVDLSIAN
jgi:hypothetical protein